MNKTEMEYISDVLQEAKRLKDSETGFVSLPFVEDSISLDTLGYLLKLLEEVSGRSATITINLSTLRKGNIVTTVSILPTGEEVKNKKGYYCNSCKFRDNCDTADLTDTELQDEYCEHYGYQCKDCPERCRCYNEDVDDEDAGKDVEITFLNTEE